METKVRHDPAHTPEKALTLTLDNGHIAMEGEITFSDWVVIAMKGDTLMRAECQDLPGDPALSKKTITFSVDEGKVTKTGDTLTLNEWAMMFWLTDVLMRGNFRNIQAQVRKQQSPQMAPPGWRPPAIINGR